MTPESAQGNKEQTPGNGEGEELKVDQTQSEFDQKSLELEEADKIRIDNGEDSPAVPHTGQTEVEVLPIYMNTPKLPKIGGMSMTGQKTVAHKPQQNNLFSFQPEQEPSKETSDMMDSSPRRGGAGGTTEDEYF